MTIESKIKIFQTELRLIQQLATETRDDTKIKGNIVNIEMQLLISVNGALLWYKERITRTIVIYKTFAACKTTKNMRRQQNAKNSIQTIKRKLLQKLHKGR